MSPPPLNPHNLLGPLFITFKESKVLLRTINYISFLCWYYSEPLSMQNSVLLYFSFMNYDNMFWRGQSITPVNRLARVFAQARVTANLKWKGLESRQYTSYKVPIIF